MQLRNYAKLYPMKDDNPGILIIANPGVTISTIDRILVGDIAQFLDEKGHEFIDTDQNRHNLKSNVRTYALFNDRHPYAELALNDLGKVFFAGQRLPGNTAEGRSFTLDPKSGLFVNKIPGVEYDVLQARDDLYFFLR
jgi:hypothetical protein